MFLSLSSRSFLFKITLPLKLIVAGLNYSWITLESSTCSSESNCLSDLFKNSSHFLSSFEEKKSNFDSVSLVRRSSLFWSAIFIWALTALSKLVYCSI
jgi:hypothetical protein